MKNKILTILSVVAFVGGFFLLYFSGPKQAALIIGQTNQVDQQTNSLDKWETKTDEQASVTVSVTPTDIFPQSKEWKFNVVMDTHSVELNQDLVKSAVLADDQGKEYKPLSWNGSEPGGHHREGVLIWNAIEPTPKSVEIKIKDISEIPERSFKWDLK